MNGKSKAAKQAATSGRLSAFVRPKEGGDTRKSAPLFVDWGEVDPSLISTAVVAVNRQGGSLLFGHTRDNASYSITVFYGGDKMPYYFSCTDDGVQALVTFLYGLCDLINDAPPDGAGKPVEPLF